MSGIRLVALAGCGLSLWGVIGAFWLGKPIDALAFAALGLIILVILGGYDT